QSLRQKAYAAGNLKSTDQVRVEQQGQAIIIEPPNPQVVYVPYYDPRVVYGPWWWPEYPPVYWGPWPGYVRPGFVAGFAWGVGITVGAGFFFGAFDWPHRHLSVVPVNNFYYRNSVVRVWEHDPIHRLGVPYRALGLRQRFGRMSAAPEARREFRGHDRSSFEGRSEISRRPDARSRPDGSRPDTHGAPNRQSMSTGGNRPQREQRPPAFEGVGHGQDARQSSVRGHESFRHGGGNSEHGGRQR
ncbi:MAG TPA: DUF3300 domain-containing protein, partial [Nitrospirales bacterium]